MHGANHWETYFTWNEIRMNKQKLPISQTHLMIHIYASNGLHKQISENEEQETKRKKKNVELQIWVFARTLNDN